MVKRRDEKHEPKGNLGSLHTIPIFRQSLPIKPVYRVLLVCTCASGRMYTSDNCREKKRCFLNEGNSLNMVNKGLGNQKKKKKNLWLPKWKQSILIGKKDWSVTENWILKKKKWRKKKKKQKQCHCYSNHLKLAGSQLTLWLNSHITFNVPTCHSLFNSFTPTEHSKKYACTKTVKFDL